jgi:hypothetical protein
VESHRMTTLSAASSSSAADPSMLAGRRLASLPLFPSQLRGRTTQTDLSQSPTTPTPLARARGGGARDE